MPTDVEIGFPSGGGDEREQLLRWIAYLRGAVLRNIDGLTDDQARWRPDGTLLSVLGIINHLTMVEWRWIDGGMLGAVVGRTEEEFDPDRSITVESATEAYLVRAAATEATVRSIESLHEPCRIEAGADLRWVLLHLINETARHAGHADASRQLIDGATGE